MILEKKRLNQFTYRIYIFLLQEEIYLCILMNLKNMSVSSYSQFIEKKSFLYIKKIIEKLRNSNYLFIDDNLSISFVNIFGLISINLLLNILVKKENIIKESIGKTTSTSSIHVAFDFIEREWESCNNLFKIHMLNIYHPEIVIRLLRSFIFDTSFLHLIRLYLFSKSFTQIDQNKILNCIRIQLNLIFLLLYKEEFIKNLTLKVNQFKNHQNINNTHIYANVDLSGSLKLKKIQCNIIDINNLYYNTYNKKKSFVNDILIFNYVFYKQSILLGMYHKRISMILVQRTMRVFMEERIGSFVLFNFFYTSFSIQEFTFLEYLYKKINCIFPLLIDTGSTYNNVFFIQKRIYLVSPIDHIIRILSYYRFCTIYGNPLNKPNWSILHDQIIINRFERIINNLLYYYSGCKNKKSFFRIIYILRYSCIKTLAYKHKVTVNNLLNNRQSTLYQIFIRNIIFKQNLFKRRFWNLHIYNSYKLKV